MFKKKLSTDIKIDGSESRPFLDDNGRMLLDKELIDIALEQIDTYQNDNGQPAPVQPKFVEWLRDAKAHCDTGGNIVDFKQQYVQKTVPYDLYVSNTNKLNKE